VSPEALAKGDGKGQPIAAVLPNFGPTATGGKLLILLPARGMGQTLGEKTQWILFL
jgi:hypothetical protein